MYARSYLRRSAACILALTLAACGGSASTRQQDATALATPTPQPSVTTLGSGDRPLDAGTYRLDPDQLAGGGTRFPAFLATVPDGWHTIDGWILNRPRSGADNPHPRFGARTLACSLISLAYSSQAACSDLDSFRFSR